ANMIREYEGADEATTKKLKDEIKANKAKDSGNFLDAYIEEHGIDLNNSAQDEMMKILQQNHTIN
ncbi:MAG: hypothetical protein GY710_16215, partial [Desulfobacteraceae bacterium]|nr:hypothetical protein [Desulfobacteraceae bacterium]